MTSDQFVHRLVLPSVRLSDAGEYIAVAGSSMSKGHLAVEGRDVRISEPATRDITVRLGGRLHKNAPNPGIFILSVSLCVTMTEIFFRHTADHLIYSFPDILSCKTRRDFLIIMTMIIF